MNDERGLGPFCTAIALHDPAIDSIDGPISHSAFDDSVSRTSMELNDHFIKQSTRNFYYNQQIIKFLLEADRIWVDTGCDSRNPDPESETGYEINARILIPNFSKVRSLNGDFAKEDSLDLF